MKYELIPANESRFRRLIRFIVGDPWWLTYRFPFQKVAKITYPPRLTLKQATVSKELTHEIKHVEWFASWWGPWATPLLATIFPLPIIFSGRWFIERHAYLDDIRLGNETIGTAIDDLWNGYFFPWPRFLMRRWFKKRS